MSSSFEAVVSEFMDVQNRINASRQQVADAHQRSIDAQRKTIGLLMDRIEHLSGRVDRLAEQLAVRESRHG